jgi:hypothetical protein
VAARPRLAIQLGAQAVLVDGVSQRVPAQPFKLLALLAQEVRDRQAGPVRNRVIEDATGRDARDLVRELRDALSVGRPNAAPSSATGSKRAGALAPSSWCWSLSRSRSRPSWLLKD